MNPDDLIDERVTREILGGVGKPIHRSTLWRGVKDGRFPPPLKMGPMTNRWLRPEVARIVENAAVDRLVGRETAGTPWDAEQDGAEALNQRSGLSPRRGASEAA